MDIETLRNELMALSLELRKLADIADDPYDSPVTSTSIEEVYNDLDRLIAASAPGGR